MVSESTRGFAYCTISRTNLEPQHGCHYLLCSAGELGQQNFENVRYEGYGPGGFAVVIDALTDNHEAVIITRNGQHSVVMQSLEDFTALEETAYLLRSPVNAKRLMGAIDQLSAGGGTERKLSE